MSHSTDSRNAPSGRALDTAVAEAVLGWIWYEGAAGVYRLRDPQREDVAAMLTEGMIWPTTERPEPYRTDGVPPFSTDIGAAWQVVEHLRAQHWEVTLLCWAADIPTQPVDHPYDCRFTGYVTPDGGGLQTLVAHKRAATMPLAICRAALQALQLLPPVAATESLPSATAPVQHRTAI